MNKKIVQLLFKMAICVILIFTLSGCWGSRELNNLSIVTGIGIDKGEVPGDISITAQIVKPAEMKKPSNDSTEGGGTAYWNLKSSSQTIFDAFREFTHETSNKLYLTHTQVIILGKDIAADGAQKYLDFFMRSHETRPTTLVLVASGTASEVLDVKPELDKLPAMNIAKLAKAQGFTSYAEPINLQEFTARLLSNTTSPIAPLITITGEDKNKIIHIEDMVVFKRDKLAGVLNPAETRGLLWVLGKVKSGAIIVNFPDGKASLVIVKAESEVTAEIKDGKPYIHISIKEEGNLTDQTLPENLATLPGLSSLEQRQNDVIRGEIQAAIKKAKDLNTDIFGFGDKVHKKYRNEWRIMEDNWDRIFPKLQVEVDIESHIRAAGLIIKPAIPESADKKE